MNRICHSFGILTCLQLVKHLHQWMNCLHHSCSHILIRHQQMKRLHLLMDHLHYCWSQGVPERPSLLTYMTGESFLYMYQSWTPSSTLQIWYLQYSVSSSKGNHLLYHFDWFGCHTSQGLWSWLNSVTCPTSQPLWPTAFGGSKKWSKKTFKKIFTSVGHMPHHFLLIYLSINEVQMLIRYSKIMQGNCCNIQSSLLSTIMSCHQWVIRSPDWTNHSFLTTTKLFSPTLPLHILFASPWVSHSRLNFRPCLRSCQHWM